jgi:V/A-type H+-transporting ATPase subunit E
VIQSDARSHEVLREEILADAHRQAKRMIRNAERDAEALIAKANEESDQERRQRLATAEETAERKRVLALASVPVEVGRMRALRVEQELQVLRKRVRDRLSTREGLDYGQLLVSLATDALQQMEGDAFVLELSKRDVREFKDSLPAAVLKRLGNRPIRLVVSDATATVEGGVIVRDSEGRQVWDNSLEARLDRLWPLLRNQLAECVESRPPASPSSGGRP